MNDIKHDIKKRHKNLTEFRYIAVGFFLTILSGAIMLSLPFSSRDGQWTNFLDSLFTATSATCVTGLVVFDTFRHWSIIGQLVILVLIQIGGMGFISIGVAFSMLLHKKIGLRQRDLMQESVNALEIGGIVRLFSVIIRGTFLIEGIGAVLLAIRFIPDFGIIRGIYFSVFHSISAFCNAGFDLMGINEEYSSFTKYAADPLVNITIMLLIIIGGIGFTIWNEVRIKKLKFSRYSLHAKIVISTTLILVFGGGLFMYIFEKSNTIAGIDTPGAIFVIRLGYGENGRLQYSRHSSTDTGEQAFDYSAHVHRRKPGLDSRRNQNHNHGGHDNLYCFLYERKQRLQCVWQENKQ